MGFLDFFKPKWKHSDADVRAEAVKQLGSDEEKLLAEVLKHDPDARIRRIALKKIDDPQLLGEIADADPDEALRRDAGDKAQAVLQATAIAEADEARSLNALERLKAQRAIAEVAKRAGFESVRKAALARIDDQKAVADVARRSDDPHLRRQAVDRVSDAAVLRDIAINDSVKEVAVAAVERIADEQALENVVKKTKSKVVRALAKERLEKLREAQRPKGGLSPEKRRAQLALVIRAVEEAAASDDFSHAEQAFELAKKELAELGAGTGKGEEAFQKRYDRALLRYQARSQEKQAIERATAAAEERKKRAAEEQQKRAVESQERSAEDAKLKEIADAARKEENEKRAAERARRDEERAKRDAEKAERDKEKAAEREKKEAEAQDGLKRVEEAAVRLESLLAGDDADRKVLESALKSTDDVVKSAGRLPREKGNEARDRHSAARAKLVIKLQELRESEDWKRWANVPKLEALCARMDALVASVSAEGAEATVDLKAAGAELKALQTEWKTVGAAPKDKSEALWKRFKAAGDQVYERVKGKSAGAVSDEERAANLAKKEELAARVETLAATPDDQINWKETAETIKVLQEEWKGIGQVPTKDQSDAVWKKFRAACDTFFDRRKAHFGEVDAERGENLKKQEALCARAEQLAAQGDDAINWKDTSEQLKGLQADWKQIGPGPKDQTDTVWNRFRAACDSFFERRKKFFDAQDAARAENLKKKELLCEKAEALKDADDHEAATAEVKKLQADWKSVGPAPKEQADAVWNRFREACDVVFDRARNPDPLPPAPTPPVTPGKAALSGFAEKLQAATSEWEDLAGSVEDKKTE